MPVSGASTTLISGSSPCHGVAVTHGAPSRMKSAQRSSLISVAPRARHNRLRVVFPISARPPKTALRRPDNPEWASSAWSPPQPLLPALQSAGVGGALCSRLQRPRIVAAVGEGGARELLDVLTRPEADRAALIGRLSQRDDAAWLAEVLTDLEVDEVARLQMIDGLRRVVS